MEPAAAPAEAGLKVAVKTTLWPVIGKTGPVMLKPEPEAVAAETVALVPPVLVTVTL
jgi:hypothetical protein